MKIEIIDRRTKKFIIDDKKSSEKSKKDKKYGGIENGD